MESQAKRTKIDVSSDAERLLRVPTAADIKAMNVGDLLATEGHLANGKRELAQLEHVVRQEISTRMLTFQINTVSGDLVTVNKPLDSNVSSLKAECLNSLGKPCREMPNYKIVIDDDVCNNNDPLRKYRPAEDGGVVHATLVKSVKSTR